MRGRDVDCRRHGFGCYALVSALRFDCRLLAFASGLAVWDAMRCGMMVCCAVGGAPRADRGLVRQNTESFQEKLATDLGDGQPLRPSPAGQLHIRDVCAWMFLDLPCAAQLLARLERGHVATGSPCQITCGLTGDTSCRGSCLRLRLLRVHADMNTLSCKHTRHAHE